MQTVFAAAIPSSTETVFPLLDLPLELRYQIYEQVFEPNKPLGLPKRSENGAKAARDPRWNILFTSKQIRKESTRILQDTVSFMLNLGHASVYDSFSKRSGCDTTGDDARKDLWKSIGGFKTVILSLGTTSTEKLTRATDLELPTDNMGAVFRALCGRGIDDGPRKSIVVKFNPEQLRSGCRGSGRFLAVLQTWIQFSTMISVRCDINASTSHAWGRVEVFVNHGADESEQSQ